jgi:hypothetical protein
MRGRFDGAALPPSPRRVRTFTIQPVIRKRFAILGVAVVVTAIASKRGRRARKTYATEVSAGSKPIEAVGTAIAAFVGF